MKQMRIRDLYDLTHTLAADYLSGFTYPWAKPSSKLQRADSWQLGQGKGEV